MEFNPVDLVYQEYGALAASGSAQGSAQAAALVCLHGFPFDHTIWEPLAPLLQDQVRLILPDLRGFGGSPVTDDVYSMRMLAEDVVHLLDRLEIEKVILVGHSMGGYVALAFAQAYPGRLAGLALLATQAAADSPERRQTRYKTAEAVVRKGARVVASDMVSKLTPRAELLKPIRDLILRANPTAISGALKGMAERPDLTGALQNICVPAVVMVGADDQLLNKDRVETMAQMLPKSWLVEIPHAGHMLMMEDPQAVAAHLRQLISMAAE